MRIVFQACYIFLNIQNSGDELDFSAVHGFRILDDCFI